MSSFRAVIGGTLFVLGTVVHVAAIACPYWFTLTSKDIHLHEGLWEICLSNKTSGLGQCRLIPSSYPVWFHGVQTLECFGALLEFVTIAIAVRYLCRGVPYYNWICQFFSIFAGILNASGVIVYTQRTYYPEWNLVQSSDAVSQIAATITDRQSELSWAFGLVIGSSGLDCFAAVLFVWESCCRRGTPTISSYQRLT